MKKRLLDSSSSSSSGSSPHRSADNTQTDPQNDHITTQLLEQILMSSQDDGVESVKQRSTFTQKYKARTHLQSIDDKRLDLEGKIKDDASGGVITIHTQRSAIGNGTGATIQESHRAKNWRHLITPAHDSFKKLEKSRRPGVQFSHHQQRDQMTNQGSTGQINLNDQVSQARPLIFTSQHTHTHSLEEMTAPISLNKHEPDDSKSGASLMSVKEFNTPAMILTQEEAHTSSE